MHGLQALQRDTPYKARHARRGRSGTLACPAPFPALPGPFWALPGPFWAMKEFP